MPKQASGWQNISPVLFWTCSGAIGLACVAIIERHVNGLPLQFSQLSISALLGALAGILFGVSEQRQRNLHNRLAESEKRFRTLHQNTPAILHSMDAGGRLLYVSQTWLDCLGYERDQVIGMDFFDLVIDTERDSLKRQHLETLAQQGEIKDVRYRLRRANDSEMDVSITEASLNNAQGEMVESLAVISDLTSHLAAEERIQKLAYYDSLTGLPNRVLLYDRMLQAMAHAKRDNRQLGIFFFDLDRFKMINDTQGHAVGDLVLRSVAQRLRKFIREGDTFARLGGDEFVIVQADPNHDPNFTMMARRILETMSEPYRVGDREFYTTASIGVSIYPLDGDDPHTLLKSADTAMYVAKSQGRNNSQFFSSAMNAQAVAKTDLEARLRNALKNQQLTMHYQPQVDLNSGRIIGVEALLRWFDEAGRVIPPEQIINVAEESGLIFPLGEWTLQAACRQAKSWQDAGLPPVRMAVNLSGHHIRQANFIDQIEQILDESGLEARFLEIELAETSVMSHVDDIIMALTDLKVRGIYLAIDDFGTGYSSLLYLKHFPIHRIKIAQEFVSGINHDHDDTAITQAIIAMARSLNLAVTAVGVEDQGQLDFLRTHGCEEIQGTIIYPPLPADEITRLLAQRDLRIAEVSAV